MRPRHDRVLVLPDSEEKGQVQRERESGLVVVENATHKLPPTMLGTVVATGDKVEGLHQGDRVVYPRHAGTVVVHDEQDHYMLRDSEIIATTTETGNE